MKKILIRILLIIGILLVLAGIGYTGYGIYKKYTLDIPNPVATIEVEDFGTIKIELYPDKAPNTVANFIKLANRGFYSGTTFHRTVPDFVIQGGAKDGDSTASPELSDLYDLDQVLNDKKLFESILDEFYGGVFETEGDAIEIESYSEMRKFIEESEDNKSKFDEFLDVEYSIPGEFIANDYKENNLKHEDGVISMARSDYSTYGYTTEGYNSAGCQFFITSGDNTSLDGLYSAFGKVTEGMDVVEKISNVEVYYREDELESDEKAPEDEDGNTIPSDTPKEEPVIKSITIDTFGVDYGNPETLEPFDINSLFYQQYNQYVN